MDPFLGQIQPFGFSFAPRGWAQCKGQLLPIASYTALFSLLGTTFGGDGRSTFGLPDLQGRSMIGIGRGPGLPDVQWGEKGGRNEISIQANNMPPHGHNLGNQASVKVITMAGEASNESDNGANGLLTGGSDIFVESPTGADFLGGVGITGKTENAGGGIPLNIENPYLGINMCIATQGIYPSRS